MKRVDTTIRLLVEMPMTNHEQEFMINAAARDWADAQALDPTRVRRSCRHLEAQAIDPDEDLI